MKIILSGYHNPRYLTITEYMERAALACGHRLNPFDDRRFLFPGRIRKTLPLIQTFDLQLLNLRLFRLVANLRPDLLIVTGGHRILKRTVQKVNALGSKTVLWTTDAPREFSSILRAAPFYDLRFCQGSEAVKIFSDNGMNSRLLPMACSPDSHYSVELSREERQTLAHDIVFVGSYYENRADLFEQLTGFDLAVWGPGWQQLASTSGLRRCLKGAHTPPARWRKIYSGARIVLATHFQNQDDTQKVHQASPRVFEAMACGAFVITDNQKDVLDIFEDGKHLVCFTDARDLKSKIQYFLKSPEERRRIALRGQQEVLSKHTYEKRIESLLSFLK